MTVPQLTFPPAPWPQIHEDRLSQAATVLMAATVGALGRAQVQDYSRQVITQGQRPLLAPSVAAQLVVNFEGLYLGKAGQQQYQYPDGNQGKFGMYFARFGVTAARSWPLPAAGLAPSLPTPDQQAGVSDLLWRDAWIVWSAMLAVALGGVTPSPSPQPINTNPIWVGPLIPQDPAGGIAAWTVTVDVQM